MELKKFEAPTLAEALQVIKRELGPEAVILTTKNKRSSLGLLNRSSVEVTAAVAPEALERKRLAEANMSAELRAQLDRKPSQKVIRAYDMLSGTSLSREMRAPAAPSAAASALAQAAARARGEIPSRANSVARANLGADENLPPPSMTQRRYADIRDDESPAEQATLRSTDRSQISPSLAQAAARAGQAQSSAAQQVSNGIPGLLQKVLAKLIASGVEADLVRELGDELKVVMLREHITREDLLTLRFARIVMSRLRVARPLTERLRVPSAPRIIAFVGPTGVGKTTTIAKIAAEIVINQKRPVTLATTDTFKIAAIEQLQTYANILKVPLEVCPTAESLEQVSSQLGPDEVVLVDTAGYGPRDEKRLQEMQEILGNVRAEKHLCVASTTRDSDLREIVRRFRMFEPDYMVVTKLDETSIYGNVFNITVRSHLPLSYFTMGQRVPEDIEVATRERVADLLLDVAGGEESWTKPIV